jgi:hypothetical protein
MSAIYLDAPLEDMAEDIIIKYDELIHCNSAKIKYLFKRSEKSKYLGKCSKASGKWAFLTDVDYVVEVWEQWWKAATDHQKEALLYHELRHVEMVVKMKDEEEVVKWKIKKHCVEVFFDEIRRYGAWNGELTELKNLLK